MVTEDTPCRHHWLIEAPNGETSEGRCKICGATREFINGQMKVTRQASSMGRFPKRDEIIGE